MLSGVGDFNTTTDFPDRFEVGIPPTYDYQGAPLVVAFHGIGQSQNQWRLTGNVTVSNGWYDGLLSSLVLFDPPTIVKPTLYQDVLDRGWFYMAPHGRVGPPNSALDPDWQPYFGTPQDEVNPPLTGSSIYPHAKGTPNNWNNIIVFEQFKKILEYTVNHYPIDKTRIYFVGFSQGGGCALNFAAQLNDANPSAICPAAVASVGGTFNTWKLWEKYAASSIHSASPYWNTPGRDESNAPAGDVLIFWNNCSGNLDYLPVELTHGGAGSGVSANELSSFTPSDAPFIYNRTTTVGSNLVASTYVASTGMFNNLKHLPLYVMYSPEDSQGDIVTYASNLLAHELSSNNIHSNYKLQVSSADDIENMWIGLGMVSAAFDGLPVSSNIGYGPGKDASGDDVYKQVDIKTGTHHLGMVNQNDMLNFLSSATLNFPTEASTMVVGNDNYFYFRLKMSASFNQYSSSLLTSGLGVFNWKIDRPANTLWVSAINSLINTGAAINSPYFDPILADFNISNTNPLKIYNLSSTLYPSTENRILNISNIESIPSKIIYSRYVNGSLATSEILIKNGNNFRRPTVSGVICTYSSGQTTLTLNRLGYYEIYP
jgi:pimeloyl-ACP methyl ester carboxylesterase